MRVRAATGGESLASVADALTTAALAVFFSSPAGARFVYVDLRDSPGVGYV